jgi:hypothetical protein
VPRTSRRDTADRYSRVDWLSGIEPQLDVTEAQLHCIDADQADAATIDLTFAGPDLNAIQMFIVPTEGDLQYLVALVSHSVATHQKPALCAVHPNFRLLFCYDDIF